MATKPAETPAAEAPPAKKGKKKLFLIIGLVVLLLVLCAAGALIFLKKKSHDSDDDGEDVAAAEPVKKVQMDRSHPPVFVPLDPFTVNLQPENGDQVLQLILSLRAVDAKLGEEVKLYVPELRHRILNLLATKKASEIISAKGHDALANEICIESNKVLGEDIAAKRKAVPSCDGPIVAVLFTSFIVQ